VKTIRTLLLFLLATTSTAHAVVTATDFQNSAGPPGVLYNGEVWYDTTAGRFCSRYAGTTDCFAEVGLTMPHRVWDVVADCGAKGDWPGDGSAPGTNDTAAFQSCLNKLAASGGGVMTTPTFRPDGTVIKGYRVDGPLTFDTGSGLSYSYYEIQGNGANIWPNLQSDHASWLTYTNTHITFRDLVLMGWNGSLPVTLNAHNPYRLLSCGSSQVNFFNVWLNGMLLDQAAPDSKGGGIYGDGCSVNMAAVRIDSPVNTTNTPAINLQHWISVTIDHLSNVDFLSWKNQSPSLGAGVTPQIVIGKPKATTRSIPNSGGGRVVLTNFTLDEGSGSLVIGADLQATLLASFTMPSYPVTFPVPNAQTVTINVSTTAWMEVDDIVYIPGGGWMLVQSVVDATHVRVWNRDSSNTGANGNAAAGTTVTGTSQIVSGQGPISLRAENFDINHAGFVGEPMFDLRSVMHTEIKNVYGREAGKAVKARYCNDITIDGWETSYYDNAPVRTLDIDSTNALLRVVNSDLDTVTNVSPKQLIVEKNGSRNMAVYTPSTRPSASIYASGTPIWDSSLKHTLISDSGAWKDTTLQPQKSIIDWLTSYVARGGTAPTILTGNYTTGAWFYLTTPGQISGARIYFLPGSGGARNMKVSLWRSNLAANSYTRLESQTVNMNASGPYSVTWANGSAGGAWLVTGADLNKRYAVTVWDTGAGGFYQYAPLGGITTKPAAPIPPAANNPIDLKPGLVLETWYAPTTAQTDSAPEDGNGYTVNASSFVEPTVLIY
jgi:hypothetical protein